MLLHVCCRKKIDFSLKAVLKCYFYFSAVIVLSVDDDSDDYYF